MDNSLACSSFLTSRSSWAPTTSSFVTSHELLSYLLQRKKTQAISIERSLLSLRLNNGTTKLLHGFLVVS